MLSSRIATFFLIFIVGQVCSNYGTCPINMTTYAFGKVFLSNSGLSLSRGPLTMVLPPDSEFLLKQRVRRHVICGRTIKNRKQSRFFMNFERRALCPYRQVINQDLNRVPELLEEVACECERPSHLSPYTNIRCHSLKFRMPVLYKNDEGGYIASHVELTLACIPLVPKDDEDSFEIHSLH